MTAFNRILEKAAAKPKRIVLPEASDDRILKAAAELVEKKLAAPILVGDTKTIQSQATELGLSLEGLQITDPNVSPERPALVSQLVEKRAHRGMDEQQAQQALTDPFVFACMMVNAGVADGCVAGAITPTASVVRGAMQLIQKSKNTELVSSFFIMRMQDWHPVNDVMVIADCALVIDPNANELAGIAASTGDSAIQLLDIQPEVGMLSFSTAGSAKHKLVDKVQVATQRLRVLRPDWRIVGEVQLDAAINPEILAKKAPDQAQNTPCNTLIFPNLDAGNIGYKLIERFGGAQAIGPVLQGLNKPVNDLSRGCNQSDIVNLAAVTAAQCSE